MIGGYKNLGFSDLLLLLLGPCITVGAENVVSKIRDRSEDRINNMPTIMNNHLALASNNLNRHYCLLGCHGLQLVRVIVSVE